MFKHLSNQCIFCLIVQKEKPCFQMYEDDLFFGFLDTHPLNPGNTLLIPKIHYRWVYDVPQFGAFFETAKKIGLAIQKATKCHSINFLTLGYQIQHAHIRIISRFKNDGHENGILLYEVKKISDNKMKELATSIQMYL